MRSWPGRLPWRYVHTIGMLKILELRRDAEAALGSAFDIREFHDRILRVSSLALPVIEADIRDWIEERRACADAGGETIPSGQ